MAAAEKRVAGRTGQRPRRRPASASPTPKSARQAIIEEAKATRQPKKPRASSPPPRPKPSSRSSKAREALRDQVAALAVKGAEQILKREVDAGGARRPAEPTEDRAVIMAELATIARPYAEALFRVAEAGDLAAWSDLVSELAQVARQSRGAGVRRQPEGQPTSRSSTRLLSLVKSPLETPKRRTSSRMLVENGRLPLLPEIAAQFHVLKNAQEGAADAHDRQRVPDSTARS